MHSDDRRIVALAKSLLARLEKEVARADAGTVAVGGITKAGNALEVFLEEIAVELGLDSRARGIGDLCVVISSHRGPVPAGSLAAEVIKELRKPRNRVDRMRLVRNRNGHGGRDVSLAEARDTMRQLESWLRGCLAAAGSDR